MLIETTFCPYCRGGNDTPCFALYDNGYKCFSCGVFKNSDRSYQETKILILSKNIQLGNVKFTPKLMPLDLRKWLMNFYISEELIKTYNIGYTDNSLVYYINETTWQQRFFPDKKIKSKGINEQIFIASKDCTTSTLVIVEDYISAIRVGEFCNCLCLWGTHLSRRTKEVILKTFNNFVIWLDGDEPGRRAAEKISQSLMSSIKTNMEDRAFAVRESRTVDIILTERDPKCHTNIEIKQILGDVN